MTSRLKSVGIPVVIAAAVGVITVGACLNDFFLLRLKSYSIPAGSMLPTLEVGDGFLERRTFRIFGEIYSPVRGDIIVFTLPEKPGTTYVKRLIGLPGETVRMEHGKVFIDGQPVPQVRADDYVATKPDGTDLKIARFTETLANGRSYATLDLVPAGSLDSTKDFLVPDGELFVLGDNRDNSVDSRMMSNFGFVPIDNVTGVAEGVYYSESSGGFLWRPLKAEAP